jgi:uncharacterized protein YndB with AHSA1/START domain
MSSENTLQPATAADEFAITRVINASPSQVWQAFTQASQLQQWWGPWLITNIDCQIDLRVGGRYRVVQEFNGTLYPLKGEFRLIEPHRQLVMSMDCSEHPPEWHDAVNPARGNNANPAGIMVMSVLFEALPDGKTQLTLRTKFESAAIRNVMVPMGMHDGWRESFEKLDDLVSGTSARAVTVSRLFNFPVAQVFDAFTQADKLAQWWGPDGFTITTQRMDFREGGIWQFTMHGPAADGKPGIDYLNKILFTRIVPGQLITHAHGDDKMDDLGNGALFQAQISFAGFANQTRVTNRVVFDTAQARDFVVKSNNAIEGGKQTLARLAQYLAQAIL